MATYSIRDLQKISGIKAHTIRIWEQRYKIIEPKRTPSNIRYYTDDDLKFLMNIAFLNRKGIKISKIAKMSYTDIVSEVENLSSEVNEDHEILQPLAIAMIDLDEDRVNYILNASFEELGVRDCILHVLNPFLKKVSTLWLTGSISVVHEQFINNLIKKKIIQYTEELMPPIVAPKVLIYLPTLEQHDILAFFAAYLFKDMGFNVLFIGHNIGIKDLRMAMRMQQVDYVFTVISEQHKFFVAEDYLEELVESIQNVVFLVMGHQLKDESKESDSLVLLNNFQGLIDTMNNGRD